MSFATRRMRPPESQVTSAAPPKLTAVEPMPYFSNSGLVDYKQGFGVIKANAVETPPPGPTLLASIKEVPVLETKAAKVLSAEDAARHIAQQFTQSDKKKVTAAVNNATEPTPAATLKSRLSAVEDQVKHMSVGLDNHTQHLRQVREGLLNHTDVLKHTVTGLHNHTDVLTKTVAGMHNHTSILQDLKLTDTKATTNKNVQSMTDAALDSKQLMQKYAARRSKTKRKMSVSQMQQLVA